MSNKLEITFDVNKHLIVVNYDHLFPHADFFRDTLLGPFGFGDASHSESLNILHVHYYDDAIWIYSNEGSFTEQQVAGIKAFIGGVLQSHNSVVWE